jgi:hypothetical protein
MTDENRQQSKGPDKEESGWTRSGIIFGIPLAVIVVIVIWFFGWVFWGNGVGNMSLNSFSILLLLVWVLMNAALFLAILWNAKKARRNFVATLRAMLGELTGMAGVAIGAMIVASLLVGAFVGFVQQIRNALHVGM